MLVKFPLIRQFDARDCGPSCVQMVAAYFGKRYSLQYLRLQSFLTREGVSLMGISDCAENIGFKTYAGRFTFDKLVHKAPLPCIVHWNQNHFVVIFQIKRKRALRGRSKYQIVVADPGKGIVKYNKEEFLEHWVSTRNGEEDKGIALLLQPTSKFYELEGEPKKRGSISLIYRYIVQYKKYFIQLLLGLLLGSMLQLIFPFLTQAIVDVGISNQNIGFIYLVLLAQMVLFLSRTMVDFIRRWILLMLENCLTVQNYSAVFLTGNIWNYLLSKAKILSNHIRIRTNNKISI